MGEMGEIREMGGMVGFMSMKVGKGYQRKMGRKGVQDGECRV